MKITPDLKITIQNAFKVMNSKTDFLTLLNLAKLEIYGEKTIPFSEKQLNYYITKDLKKNSINLSSLTLIKTVTSITFNFLLQH